MRPIPPSGAELRWFMAVLEKLSVPGVANTSSGMRAEVLGHLRHHFRAFESLNRAGRIGIELEYPVLCANGRSPDWDFLKNFLTEFGKKDSFQTLAEDVFGRAIRIQNAEGDVLSYEFTYGMLEFSLAPRSSLFEIHSALKRLYTAVADALAWQDHFLAGIGVHPFSWKGELPIVDHPYYQMTYHYLGQFRSYSPEACRFNALMSSSQVHLDLDVQSLPRFLTIMDEIQWLKLLLFSNSPSCFGNPFSTQPDLCLRDLYWAHSAFADNPNNVGGLETQVESYDEVLESESRKSIFRVIRNGVPIFFEPILLSEFLLTDEISGTAVIRADGTRGKSQFVLQKTKFQPNPADLSAFRPYTHTAITARGTVEIRSDCQQPGTSVLAPAAFNLGILENLNQVSFWLETLQKYWHSQSPSGLRRKAAMAGFEMQSPYVNRSLDEVLTQLLDLCSEGLKRRGLGEEAYLDSLFERVRKRTNPAIEWMGVRQSSSAFLQALKTSGELK